MFNIFSLPVCLFLLPIKLSSSGKEPGRVTSPSAISVCTVLGDDLSDAESQLRYLECRQETNIQMTMAKNVVMEPTAKTICVTKASALWSSSSSSSKKKIQNMKIQIKS